MQQDYVIYCPVSNVYAYYDSNLYCFGWAFDDNALNAEGFNDPEIAHRHINGLVLPSGQIVSKPAPELKGCEVHKRTIMVQTEKV